MKPFPFTTRLLTALVILLLAVADMHAGGPWLLKKKAGFFQAQTTITAYPYNSLLTGTSIRETQGINREVWHVDYGLYGEYGLSDKFNIMASIPFKHARTGARTDSLYDPVLLDSGSINGLGNLGFGLKYGLVDKNVKVALSAQANLNTASEKLDQGLATGFLANSFGLFAHVGGSLNSKWYLFGELGFLKYTNDYSDVIQGQIEVGRTLGKSLTVMLSTSIRQSLENGSFDDSTLLQTGLFADDQEWIGSSVKLNYQSKNKWGASLGFPLVPVQFNNIGFAGAVSLGAYVKI